MVEDKITLESQKLKVKEVKMQEKFEVGKIVNTFGIKGEVKVTLYTENISNFKKGNKIYVGNLEMLVEHSRLQKNVLILKLKGIDNMTDAENLRGNIIQVMRNPKELPVGTYYIADLVGLDVYTDEGNLLGKIVDIYNTGANDIYTVKTLEGKEVLLPAIKDVIKQVDLQNEKVIVHILKGLL